MIEVYIGQLAGGWAVDGRMQGWSAHASPAVGLDHWIDEIESRHASRWRKASVDLWLSGGLARPFLCGPVSGLNGWKEAEAFAVAAAPEPTGLAGPCRVTLEAWPGDGPVVATAVEAGLAEILAEFAKTRRIRWRNVRPRWAAALDDLLERRPSAALFAFAEADALTLLVGSSDGGREPSPTPHLASTYAPAPDPVDAQALWKRQMLAHDVSADDAWFGRVAGAVDPSDDLLDDRRAGWPALATGTESASS